MIVVKMEVFSVVPFFSSFTKKQLEQLRPFLRIGVVKAGEKITEQGSLNLALNFLLDGEVSIFVDDVLIIEIDTLGQLFGEVSMVAHQPSSASVVAKKECIFLTLDYDKFREIKDMETKMLIYKACAEVLAHKLIKSNDTAKTFKSS